MKKLKYIAIAFAVIVLAVGGYLAYEFKFKTYDTADTEVDALLEESFEIELPDGSVIHVDKEGNVVEGKVDNSAQQTTEETDSTNGNGASTDSENSEPTSANDDQTATNPPKTEPGKDPASNPTPTEEKVTVATIKAKYEQTFANLENQSRARLDALISQAYSEYSAKKKNGESISYGYFYQKYMGAATAVESATDATVKVMVGLVEKDLQENGFDKSYAQTFAEDYKTTKKALRDELMDKALSFK